LVVLTLGSVNRSFAYRKGTIDEAVIAQALKVGAYDLGRLRRGNEMVALYDRLAASGRPPLIIDAAANIGAAVVFFAYQFPKARIVALEPDAAKFALLTANTADFPVECLQASIAAEDGAGATTPHITINDIYRRALWIGGTEFFPDVLDQFLDARMLFHCPGSAAALHFRFPVEGVHGR